MPEPSGAREVLDAIVAAFAVLGGSMAYASGLAASIAEAAGATGEEIGRAASEALPHGFRTGVLFSTMALIIVMWG